MDFSKLKSRSQDGSRDQESLSSTSIFKKLYRDGNRMLNPTNPYQLKPDNPKDLKVSFKYVFTED